MADRSAIEWCDSTFNPWTGCTKISPACDHCYAESLSKRAPKTIAQWGAGQPRRRTSAANWRKPLQWNRALFHECIACGWRGEDRALVEPDRVCPGCSGNTFRAARRRVFCASLADVFDNEVPLEWRRDLYELIAATPNLDWLLLTKRIGNVRSLVPQNWMSTAPLHLHGWPPNVWIGDTICNQAEADRDIPKLLATPARVRFLSIEPMLGQIDLTSLSVGRGMNIDWASDAPPHLRKIRTAKLTLDALRGAPVSGVPGLNWVIAGGESGPHARPSHPDWFRSLRDQCAAAGVPFLFKQWGEWAPYNRGRHDPTSFADPTTGDTPVQRFGKKLAGRLLDGREHNGFPA